MANARRPRPSTIDCEVVSTRQVQSKAADCILVSSTSKLYVLSMSKANDNHRVRDRGGQMRIDARARGHGLRCGILTLRDRRRSALPTSLLLWYNENLPALDCFHPSRFRPIGGRILRKSYKI